MRLGADRCNHFQSPMRISLHQSNFPRNASDIPYIRQHHRPCLSWAGPALRIPYHPPTFPQFYQAQLKRISKLHLLLTVFNHSFKVRNLTIRSSSLSKHRSDPAKIAQCDSMPAASALNLAEELYLHRLTSRHLYRLDQPNVNPFSAPCQL